MKENFINRPLRLQYLKYISNVFTSFIMLAHELFKRIALKRSVFVYKHVFLLFICVYVKVNYFHKLFWISVFKTKIKYI